MKFYNYVLLVAATQALKLNQADEGDIVRAIDPAVPSPHANTNLTNGGNESIPVPWVESSLPDCPDFSRTVMDDGITHVVRYPHVGATCKGEMWPEAKGTAKAQEAPEVLVQVKEEPPKEAQPAAEPEKDKPAPWVGFEHCPNMSERMTLIDGRTPAIPYPKEGFNCHNEGPATI